MSAFALRCLNRAKASVAGDVGLASLKDRVTLNANGGVSEFSLDGLEPSKRVSCSFEVRRWSPLVLEARRVWHETRTQDWLRRGHASSYDCPAGLSVWSSCRKAAVGGNDPTHALRTQAHAQALDHVVVPTGRRLPTRRRAGATPELDSSCMAVIERGAQHSHSSQRRKYRAGGDATVDDRARSLRGHTYSRT